MKKLKKFNGGQIYSGEYRNCWFYVGAYSQKHLIDLMKEATNYHLNLSTVKDYWNKDAWGNTMEGIELIEPCVYVTDRYSKNLRRLL